MSFIPTNADEIDAGWLTEALAERHPNVRVQHVELLERHEVTNSHARLRVDYEVADGAPTSLFAKLLPGDSDRRRAIAQTRMGPREALFYSKLAPQLAMRVPTVHVARHEEVSGAFVILMEDLGTSGCSVSDGPTSVSADAAAQALEDLAQLHVRFEDAACRKALAPWVPHPDPPSDYGIVRLRYALEHHRERLSDQFAELSELYIDRQTALHALWLHGPYTVIHGDPHIGNLFFDHGRTGFLDWGLINVNTPLRDVSYFLNMALSPADRRQHEVELLRHYLDVRAASDAVKIDFDSAWRAHRIHAAYLVPASCQIVTFPENVTEQRRVFAQAFLGRVEAAIEDLEVRKALSEYAGL